MIWMGASTRGHGPLAPVFFYALFFSFFVLRTRIEGQFDYENDHVNNLSVTAL
jgi:hypothetical protein